jgi:hypothetical protein
MSDIQQYNGYDESESGAATRAKWPAFVESTVADFFMGHKLERMSVEDGNGNKAKLSLTKDNEIKVEYSSMTIL